MFIDSILYNMKKKWLKYSILSILILTLISLLGSIWLPIWQSFRIVFGTVYLLFLPGFVWSWVFWKKGEIEWIERIVLSLALSIGIVPLTVFVLNKVGIKINLFNSIFEILILVIIATIVVAVQNKKSLKNIN